MKRTILFGLMFLLVVSIAFATNGSDIADSATDVATEKDTMEKRFQERTREIEREQVYDDKQAGIPLSKEKSLMEKIRDVFMKEKTPTANIVKDIPASTEVGNPSEQLGKRSGLSKSDKRDGFVESSEPVRNFGQKVKNFIMNIFEAR